MKKINLALLCMIMHCAILNAQINYTYTQIVESVLFPEPYYSVSRLKAVLALSAMLPSFFL